MSLVADLARLLNIKKPETPYSLSDTVYYRVASLFRQHEELRGVTQDLIDIVKRLTQPEEESSHD